MKTIIAGTRTIPYTDEWYAVLCDCMRTARATAGIVPTEIISGGAEGVDRLGERWGWDNKCPIGIVLPDWKRFGKSAGPRRNAVMASKADAAVILWDGKSPGSKNIIDTAKRYGLKIHITEIQY